MFCIIYGGKTLCQLINYNVGFTLRSVPIHKNVQNIEQGRVPHR